MKCAIWHWLLGHLIKAALQPPKFMSSLFQGWTHPMHILQPVQHQRNRGTRGNSWRSQDFEAAVKEMEICSSTQQGAVQLFPFPPSLPKGKLYSVFFVCVCVKSFAYSKFCTVWEIYQLCQHWAKEKLSILRCELTFHCAWSLNVYFKSCYSEEAFMYFHELLASKGSMLCLKPADNSEFVLQVEFQFHL